MLPIARQFRFLANLATPGLHGSGTSGLTVGLYITAELVDNLLGILDDRGLILLFGMSNLLRTRCR